MNTTESIDSLKAKVLRCNYKNIEKVPIILKSTHSEQWGFERVVMPQASINFFAPYDSQLRVVPLASLNGVIAAESDTIFCKELAKFNSLQKMAA